MWAHEQVKEDYIFTNHMMSGKEVLYYIMMKNIATRLLFRFIWEYRTIITFAVQLLTGGSRYQLYGERLRGKKINK